MSPNQVTASAAAMPVAGNNSPTGKITPIEAVFTHGDSMLSMIVRDETGVKFVAQFTLGEVEQRLQFLWREVGA